MAMWMPPVLPFTKYHVRLEPNTLAAEASDSFNGP